MNMVLNATHLQKFHLVFSGNPSQIRIHPFLDAWRQKQRIVFGAKYGMEIK